MTGVTYLLVLISSQIHFAFHFQFDVYSDDETLHEVYNMQCNLLTSGIKRTFFTFMKIVTLTGQNRRFNFFRFWSKIAISMSFEKIVTALVAVTSAGPYHLQIICTSIQTDNHASTSPLSFYKRDTHPTTQPTVSKHWRRYRGTNNGHVY